MLYMNMCLDAQATIEMTLDGGSVWFQLSTSKKLDFKDIIQFVMSPDERLNMRCPDVGGCTIYHGHIYADSSSGTNR